MSIIQERKQKAFPIPEKKWHIQAVGRLLAKANPVVYASGRVHRQKIELQKSRLDRA
jgi:hypothetical protein